MKMTRDVPPSLSLISEREDRSTLSKNLVASLPGQTNTQSLRDFHYGEYMLVVVSTSTSVSEYQKCINVCESGHVYYCNGLR